jgi:hypothetical protein
MTHIPGGDYGSAWQSLAAASRKPRRYTGPYAAYTTAELIRDASAADDETRAKLEAEIARRTARKPRR